MTEDESLVRRLARLVVRGLDRTGQGPRAQVTVAELHQRLVPYEDVRPELGVATKAEYDAALLRFLHQEQWVEMEELALRQAVSDELDAPEPALAFLEEFAASPLRMKLSELWDEPEPGGEPAAEPEEEVGDAEEAGDGEEAGDKELAAVEGSAGGDGSVRHEEGEEEVAASDEEEEVVEESEEVAVAGECWKCEESLPEREDLRYCPWCGADQTVRECPSCEAVVELDWRFCPACGEEAQG